MDERIDRQLAFVLEIDKAKNVVYNKNQDACVLN